MRKSALLLLLGVLFLQPVSAQGVSIPSADEMIKALKEALEQGAAKAASFLNQKGGYLDNARFKIPFPPDALKAADKARQLGMGKQVDEFIVRMNRGAEDAAAEAKPIFINAIKEMSIEDAKGVLLGENNAATQYFRQKTYDELFKAFAPKIEASLNKFEATKYWSQVTTKYNRMPGVKKVDTDLVRYTTQKALDGLFLKLAEEELDIRKNMSSQSTPLLKKVFCWVATQGKRP